MLITAAVIGLGIGEKIAEAFASDHRCKLVAICDHDLEKLREVSTRFPGVRIEANDEKILNDPSIDIIGIASYDNFHFDQTMKAIENNKHVFVEKPFVLLEEQAQNIKKTLDDRPWIKLSSNLILRKSPRFLDLKQRIICGELGEIFYLEGDYNYGRLEKIMSGWRGKIPNYSAVHGGGVHIIDLLMWLYDDVITEVSAIGNKIISRSSEFNNFDMVVSTLRFSKGAIGKMSVNFGCVFPHFHNLSIYGSKGTFVNGFDAASLFKSRDPLTPPDFLREAYPGVHKGALVASFIDSILDVGCAIVSKEDVFRSMNVCFAIERSLAERRPVLVSQ